MSKSQRSSRTVTRSAVAAIIATTFFMLAVAGTNAAGFSLIDSVKEYFGLSRVLTPSAENSLGRNQTAGRIAASTTLVISQFDGGGGGSTGTYLFDYVEIKNISGTTQSLDTLSIYYGSA